MEKVSLAPPRNHDMTNTIDVRFGNLAQAGTHVPFRLRKLGLYKHA
jgi:hypothetical protein